MSGHKGVSRARASRWLLLGQKYFSGENGLEERRVGKLTVQGWKILGSFREEIIRWFEPWAEEDEICRSEEAGAPIRQAPLLSEPGCDVLPKGSL